MRRKGFWLLSTVTKLLRKFIPGLSHASDGLIFQVTKILEPFTVSKFIMWLYHPILHLCWWSVFFRAGMIHMYPAHMKVFWSGNFLKWIQLIFSLRLYDGFSFQTVTRLLILIQFHLLQITVFCSTLSSVYLYHDDNLKIVSVLTVRSWWSGTTFSEWAWKEEANGRL